MKNILLILLPMTILSCGSNTPWYKIYKSDMFYEPHSMITTVDNEIVICGRYKLEGYNKLFVMKLDKWGNINNLGKTDHSLRFDSDIKKTFDRGYIIATYDNVNYDDDGMIIKMDENFNIDWEYKTKHSRDEKLYSIIQLKDGSYIAVGSAEYKSGSNDFYAVRINQEGKLLWERIYNNHTYSTAYIVKEDKEGNIWIGGEFSYYLSFFAKGESFYILKIDTSGNILWDNDYTFGNGKYNGVSDMEETGEGNMIFAGYTTSGPYSRSNYDACVFCIDKYGNVLWNKNIGGTLDDKAFSIIEKDDDNYLVTGYTESYAEEANRDLYVIQIDSEGNIKSEEMIGNMNAETEISIRSLDKGRVFIACCEIKMSERSYDIGLFKFNRKLEYSNEAIIIDFDM